jgi:hypothetical protein
MLQRRMQEFWSWKMSRFLTKILNEKPGAAKPKFEIVQKADQTRPILDSESSKPQIDESQNSSAANQSKIIAPEKDFNKRANILEREALPNGFFPGASKAIYDALYLRTIGSVNPKRSVQATRKDLMKWSGIKNIKTIDTHLKKLKELNLIDVTNFIGEHTGAHFEVFLPEKYNPDQTYTKGNPDHYQKLGRDPYQKLVWVGLGNPPENKGLSESLILYKDIEKNDDEPFGKMNATLAKVAEKISGKKLQKSDAEKLNEVAEILAMELEIAVARTKSVSNVPAFLTEHLKRRLLNTSTKSAKIKLKAEQSAKAGKSEETIEEYKAESLTKEGRTAVLKTMLEYIEKGQNAFVMNQQDSYTNEDWNWLMEKLKHTDK